LVFDEQNIHLEFDNISTVMEKSAQAGRFRRVAGARQLIVDVILAAARDYAQYDVGEDSKIAAVLKLLFFVSLAAAAFAVPSANPVADERA
jgi:hypothetical protein